MEKLIIGTRNQGKAREIKSILGRTAFRLIPIPKNIPEIKETGKTYRQNALQKARFIAKATGLSVLAEDSGLEVRVLGGKPGIYSARYSGKNANAASNNRKLLKELEDVPFSRQRRASQYRCVAVLINSKGKTQITEGICKGKIALKPRGTKGFGYDPLFIPDGHQKTFGELSEKTKNRISHRAKALRKLRIGFSR